MYHRKNSAADRIVDILTFYPNSTFEQVQQYLSVSGAKISFQGLYKALAVLRSQGVVVSVQKKYSLNAVWIDQLVRLVYFMESNYLSGSQFHQVLLPTEAGQKVVYSFPDVLSMDVFWGHVAVALAAQQPGKPFYFYNPHTWFFAAHPNASQAYFDVLGQRKVKNYTVVGAQTSLDRWSAKFHPKEVSEYYCSPKQLYSNRLYITAVGSYYMEVKISHDMASKIDAICENTVFNPWTDSPPSSVMKEFTRKSSCKMTIYLDEQKAKHFAKRIARHF